MAAVSGERMAAALELFGELAHEELLFLSDSPTGLRAVIAIHDTTLGPAVGGTRMCPYSSLEAAAVEALRLSPSLTWTAALLGIEHGGGQGIILGDPGDKSRYLLNAYARAVEQLGGRFHTGPDLGIHPRDVTVLARSTRHVTRESGAGCAPELAALGVREAIRGAAMLLGGGLSGLRVSVQGLGEVGFRLARLLTAEGARLTVADLDPARAERAAQELGAVPVPPEAIYETEADVLSPNAQGGVLNDETLPQLRVRAVVGGARGQLAEERHGDALYERGIVYAPDCIASAGGFWGLLPAAEPLDEELRQRRIERIGERLLDLWGESRERGEPPHRLATRLAEERLAEARERRRRRRLPGTGDAAGSDG